MGRRRSNVTVGWGMAAKSAIKVQYGDVTYNSIKEAARKLHLTNFLVKKYADNSILYKDIPIVLIKK